MAVPLLFNIGASNVTMNDGTNTITYAGTNVNLVGGSVNDRFVFANQAV